VSTNLDQLVAAAREAMRAQMSAIPLEDARAAALGAPEPRGFKRALLAAAARGAPLIGEIKRASPSRGPIAPDLNPALLSQAYERGGAACLSVLTERKFFLGSLADLRAARSACALPALRKDFIVSSYQLWEARSVGADAVLLIAAALEPKQLADLAGLAHELNLDVLLEVHDEAELEAAAAAKPDLLGINNRNLKTLHVDRGTFARLAPLARGIAPLVAESGVRDAKDARAALDAGASALLVGEALSGAADPEAKVRELVAA
jgi:indole-3-glycerol phosphate synthase